MHRGTQKKVYDPGLEKRLKSYTRRLTLIASWYAKESLRDKSQRITILGYSHRVKRNQIIFDYLDKKYGYSWRFEAPKGIIGLDETLDTYELLQNDKADNAPNIIPHEWDE